MYKGIHQNDFYSIILQLSNIFSDLCFVNSKKYLPDKGHKG